MKLNFGRFQKNIQYVFSTVLACWHREKATPCRYQSEKKGLSYFQNSRSVCLVSAVGAVIHHMFSKITAEIRIEIYHINEIMRRTVLHCFTNWKSYFNYSILITIIIFLRIFFSSTAYVTDFSQIFLLGQAIYFCFMKMVWLRGYYDHLWIAMMKIQRNIGAPLIILTSEYW